MRALNAVLRKSDPRARYAAGPWVIEDLPNDSSLRARPLRAHGVIAGASVIVGGDAAAPLGLLGAFARRPLTLLPPSSRSRLSPAACSRRTGK